MMERPRNWEDRGRHLADPTGAMFGDYHNPLPLQYSSMPTPFICIDLKTLTFVARGEYRAVRRKAEQAGLKSEEMILGSEETGRTYSALDDGQARALYKNAFGESYGGFDYPELIKRLRWLAQQLPILPPEPAYKTSDYPEEPGLAPWSKPAVKDTIQTAPQPAPTAPSAVPAAPTLRPKEGSTTGRVWAIADAVLAENPEAPLKEIRGTIIDRCVADGINASTAATQYSKWKGTK